MQPPAGASRLAQREKVGALAQLPYLQGYNPAANQKGVVVHDQTRAGRGWNLAVSAHDAQAHLLDMSGAPHHRWALDSRAVWPDLKDRGDRSGYDRYWRRAELLPGGDLLVVWEYIGIARIDRQSRLRWALRNAAHHDLAVAGDGSIYILTHESKIVPDVNPDDPIFEDFVTTLSPDGRAVGKISLLAAFEGSDYAAVLAPMHSEGDIFHANSIQVLDGSLASRSPAFAAGNLLVGLQALNTIVILDPRTAKVVWALSGQWRGQHATHILGNGRMLLFDNFGSMRVRTPRACSRSTRSRRRSPGATASARGSASSRSPTAAPSVSPTATRSSWNPTGRAIEVTPGGETVWEYVNPFRAGEKKELLATLTQLTRLPAELPIDWADHPRPGLVSASPQVSPLRTPPTR